MTGLQASGAKTPAVARPYAKRVFQPRFAYPEMARLAEVSGSDDGTVLGTGFVRLEGAEIPWQVRYDEVLLVLEGRVTVRTDDALLSAGPMDCIWLPEGTDLVYEADDALVFYALYPANWGDAGPGAPDGNDGDSEVRP